MESINVLFLLSTFLLAVDVRAQPNNSINVMIPLGSSLSPSANRSWLSPSGLFAFGFYPQGNGFAIGIWLVDQPQNTTVWTAYRNNSPVTSKATLDLTRDGKLLFRPEEGEQNPVADVSLLAASASMLDSGNFVLYDNSSNVIWESFEYPTDTILGGQNVSNGKDLVSSVSKSDHSSGRFYLRMQSDGNLVSYPVNYTDNSENAYWSSATIISDDVAAGTGDPYERGAVGEPPEVWIFEGLLTLSLRPCTSITEAVKPRSVLQTKKTQEGKDGQNRELALEIFEAKKENFATDEVIISSASESTGKEPIFYNFIPIPESDQLQVSQGNVFVTKTHHEHAEVSTELKLDYGSCITNKRKASENLANFSLSSTACGIKRMRLNSHKVEKGKGPNGVSLELKLGHDPWVIKKRIRLSDIGHLARLLLAADLIYSLDIICQMEKRRRMYSSLNEIFTIVECTWDMARELLLLLRDCSSYSLRNEQTKHELIEVMMQEIDARENMDMTTLIETMEKWNNGNYKENRKARVM
ncbi:g-type lectin s-receptor-like serine/threonine-protein kinase rlk1 [Quercus suber]|uniref:G-type lectin s-receptor-like serine/threonine-protein kinase rlk1 n=1 Tax=Quercus suber TaxID=58331 RepID=A0AAW0KAH6_QUESU